MICSATDLNFKNLVKRVIANVRPFKRKPIGTFRNFHGARCHIEIISGSDYSRICSPKRTQLVSYLEIKSIWIRGTAVAAVRYGHNLNIAKNSGYFQSNSLDIACFSDCIQSAIRIIRITN